jgi:Zinc carboxypeptidase
MLKISYGYVNRDNETMLLLNNTNIYFIPVVNMDGFKHISEIYDSTQVLAYIRKNRNDGRLNGYTACDNDEYFGVDLNRNYDYKFGHNEIGSNSNPCAEDYRGAYPFSEPETAAVRDFVELKKSSLFMAFNFHSYGNLLIYPFNYDNSPSNNELWTKFPE